MLIEVKLKQKPVLFSSLVAISILFLIPLTVSDAHMQESILIFESPIISTTSNDYEISSDFEIRILHNGDLIRVKGMTVDGHPYYVYQKMINDEPVLFGKIFIAGKPTQIIQKATTLTGDSTSQVEETKPEKNLKIIVESSDSTQYGQSYKLTVKVYDADINPNPELFSKTDGLLEDIIVNTTITDENGNVLTTFGGTTDNAGKFEGVYYWEFTDIAGEYEIALNVDDGSHLESFNTFYVGYVAPRDSS